MDPNAAWKLMAEAGGDGEQRFDAALGLRNWLAVGGFPPRITGIDEFDRLAAQATCDAVLQGQARATATRKHL